MRGRPATLAEAAIRETEEETGLRVEVGRLLAVGDEIRETHNLFFVFEAVAVEGIPAVQDGDPVIELDCLRVLPTVGRPIGL